MSLERRVVRGGAPGSGAFFLREAADAPGRDIKNTESNRVATKFFIPLASAIAGRKLLGQILSDETLRGAPLA